MHSSIQISELYLYVGHGYFNAFCTRINKLLGDKLHYAFSYAYSIDPNTNAAVPSNLHAIPYEEGCIGEKDPLHQCYCTKTNDSNPPSSQSNNATPEPSTKVTWSSNTKPLVTDTSKKLSYFQLVMDLLYHNSEGKTLPLVYEGASYNGLLHKIW